MLAAGVAAVVAIVAVFQPWLEVSNPWGKLGCIGVHGGCRGEVAEQTVETGFDQAGAVPVVLLALVALASIAVAIHPTRRARIQYGLGAIAAIAVSIGILLKRTYLAHIIENTTSLAASRIFTAAIGAIFVLAVAVVARRNDRRSVTSA